MYDFGILMNSFAKKTFERKTDGLKTYFWLEGIQY